MAIYELNFGSGEAPPDWRKRYRYAVFEHKLVFDGIRTYSRSFIVLKNQCDVIVHFTCYHNCIEAYEKGVYVVDEI